MTEKLARVRSLINIARSDLRRSRDNEEWAGATGRAMFYWLGELLDMVEILAEEDGN